jgi:hypothetical protein
MPNYLLIIFIISYSELVEADIYKKSIDANDVVFYTNLSHPNLPPKIPNQIEYEDKSTEKNSFDQIIDYSAQQIETSRKTEASVRTDRKAHNETLAEKNKQDKMNADLEKIKLGGVPLDDFENKCLTLNFKKGTKDFGNCVLKLNDIK